MITFVNSIQEGIWNIFPIEKLKKWIDEPYNLPNYSPFTNKKFILFTGNDSLFFQSTKAFFIIYLPVVLIVFFTIYTLRKLSSQIRSI